MAIKIVFAIFSLCLTHQLSSAHPHQNQVNLKKITKTFQDADHLLNYANSIPSDDHDVPVNGLNFQTNLIEQFISKDVSDDLILSCIVKYKDDYRNTLNDTHNGAKKCIKDAKEKVANIAKKIIGIKDEINDIIEDLKTVIDVCVENNNNSTETLQCINDDIISDVLEISNKVRELQDAIIEGWREVRIIVEETKNCLNTNAENGMNNMNAVGQKIIDCINSAK